MPVTTVDQSYWKAFSVDAAFFNRFEKLVTESEDALRARLWLSDSSRIDDLTIRQLNEFPNLHSRQIRRLDISNPRDSATRLHFTRRGDSFVAPVIYEIVGDDKEASYL